MYKMRKKGRRKLAKRAIDKALFYPYNTCIKRVGALPRLLYYS